MRTVAYQKAVLIKYIQTLIAWGDQLFRQDTIESINEATQLYILAASILGERPKSVPRNRPAPVMTLYQLEQAGVDDFATPRELMVLQGRLHGLRKREAAVRAGLLLGIMGLAEEADRRLATLSGGTKRRVDLAASLMHLPPVLFLDEPTEGLDPRSRSGIWDTLDRLRSRLGVTLVLTTHYMEEGDRLCERVAIIDRGTVVAEGAPAALKATVAEDATLEDVYLHYTGRAFEDTRVAA